MTHKRTCWNQANLQNLKEQMGQQWMSTLLPVATALGSDHQDQILSANSSPLGSILNGDGVSCEGKAVFF